ncbi:unnamed protein product [Caenorhabditis bovis]|uniref:ubiquitinyl hydrolase 1 n=1 Tax=Caenorhabditis bovis TaxID=2654633 RepID=A0A8S1EJN5_9PELO|nr:unnamed protein product [Caenorhabditis bovis]
MFSFAIILAIVASCSATTPNWLTVVLVDFELREQCAEYWNSHQNCVNPSLRVHATMGVQRFTSVAWPITKNLLDNEKKFFTSQWNDEIDSLLISAQIEGENALNPFGLSPKCDHAFTSMVFNKTDEEAIKPSGKTVMTRAVYVRSQCFNAKLLIRIDDKCAHCPKQISVAKRREGFLFEVEQAIQGYNIYYINIFLASICLLSLILFFISLEYICLKKSKVLHVIPRTPNNTTNFTNDNTTTVAFSPKIANIRRITTLISAKQNDDYSEIEAGPIYKYQLNTQKVQRVDSNGDLGRTLPRNARIFTQFSEMSSSDPKTMCFSLDKIMNRTHIYDPRKIAEILSSKLNLSLTSANIMDANPDTIQVIYYNMAHFGLGINENALNQLPLDVNRDFEEGLHQRSIPLIILYNSMAAFIRDITAGKIVLNICDLIRPAADIPRLKAILSIFCDYLIVNEKIKPMIEEVFSEVNEKKENLVELQEKVRNTETRRNKLQAEATARKRRENEEIISSPDTIRDEIQSKKEEIQAMKSDLNNVQLSVTEKRHDLQISENAAVRIEWLSSKMRELLVEKNQIILQSQTVNEIERALEELSQQFDFAVKQNESAKKQETEQAEAHRQLRTVHEERTKTISENIQRIKIEIEKFRNETPVSSSKACAKREKLTKIRNQASEKKYEAFQTAEDLVNQFKKLVQVGANGSSQLEKEITGDSLVGNEHYYGLVNFGNTCYCNSVIQALYFCRPFREKILQYKQQLKKSGANKENLVTCLADLFHNIATQKRRVGTIAPKRFITKLKKENELFDNYMQQDAHEFLNYLLNTISETLMEEKNAEKDRQQKHGTIKKGQITVNLAPSSAAQNNEKCDDGRKNETTWIHEIFQGTLINETRCLCCETVSSKDEDFLDLSVDVEQNTSITHCLRVFSETETLCGDQKYFCETCSSKQEAQKRMRIKKPPQLLALHLKRFKYVDSLNRHTKLSYRVLFPLELRLFNVSDDATNGDRLYDLVAAVVHCGATPNRGHYITLVKSNSFWLLFDDDIVEKLEISSMEEFSGMSPDSGNLQQPPTQSQQQKNSESAYILFYQARDYDALRPNHHATHASI